jgi:diguanylate cyclase (GGDEF)-like protein
MPALKRSSALFAPRSRRSRKDALIDPLTGIPNRLAFDERLSEEWRRARRYKRPLGLLMLDLDELKEINDTEGHAAGDRVLRAVAECISEDIRHSDQVARLGGDEFVVLCPETPAEALNQTAEKLRERLEARGIAISMGRAELEPGDESPHDLVARADVAMHQHKQRRRTVREGTRRRQAAQQRATARPDLAIPGA